MIDKEKRAVGSSMLDWLIRGQREGESQNEIIEGIKAGLVSDYLNLDEGLAKGNTIVDPSKYTRAMDGKDEAPRKTASLERDLSKRLEQARQRCAAEVRSPEYRKKIVRQKKLQIHKEMTRRGTDEITARIRGYDVTLIRLPEIEQGTDMQKIKMYVNGSEIPDRQFDVALEEISGLHDTKAFNVAAQTAMDLKDQAGIQMARAATSAGLSAVTHPIRSMPKEIHEGQSFISQILSMLLQQIIKAVSHSR